MYKWVDGMAKPFSSDQVPAGTIPTSPGVADEKGRDLLMSLKKQKQRNNCPRWAA